MQLLKYFILLLTLGFTHYAWCDPITTTVDGGYSYGKQLQCKAYLHRPEQSKPTSDNKIKLYYFQSGTGAYTTYFDQPWIDQADYYLTIDKPGISPNLVTRNPDAPIIDRNFFDYYTTGNLTICAFNALIWADNYLGQTPKIIALGGHSEGSIVATNLLYRILVDSTPSTLQEEIKSIFLSGIVLDNMSDVVRYQLQGPDYDKFMIAYRTHDNDFFYNHYEIGWYWVDSAFHTTNPVKKILEDIAKLTHGPSIEVHFFQGLFDKEVPTQSVIDFEIANNLNPKKLNLHTRYYGAGHELNPTAFSDMELSIDRIFQQNALPEIPPSALHSNAEKF